MLLTPLTILEKSPSVNDTICEIPFKPQEGSLDTIMDSPFIWAKYGDHAGLLITLDPNKVTMNI